MRLACGMSGGDKYIEEMNTAGEVEVGNRVGRQGLLRGCLNKDPRILGMRCVGRLF